MTDNKEHPAGTERETGALHGSGEIRKGIEIVTVQDLPADYTPPTMGLGGPPPPSDNSASDGGTASE